MSDLEDDLENDTIHLEIKPVKRTLSRLKKATIRASSGPAEATAEHHLNSKTFLAANLRSSPECEASTSEELPGSPDTRNPVGVFDEHATKSEKSNQHDPAGSESESGSGDEYWDEEDELLDDLQRDVKSSAEGAKSVTSADAHDHQKGSQADTTSRGRKKRGSVKEQAQLNAETQRLLRESAVSERIGRGTQVEEAPDMKSRILAKLLAQNAEVMARRPVLPKREDTPSSSDDDSESEADDSDQEMVLDIISDDETPQAGLPPIQLTQRGGAPISGGKPGVLGGASCQESARSGASVATEAEAENEAGAVAPVEETLELDLALPPDSQSDYGRGSAMPSLHLSLDSQLEDSESPESIANVAPQQSTDAAPAAGFGGSTDPSLVQQQSQRQAADARRLAQCPAPHGVDTAAYVKDTKPTSQTALPPVGGGGVAAPADGLDSDSEADADDEEAILNAAAGAAGSDANSSSEEEDVDAISDNAAASSSSSDDDSDAEEDDSPPVAQAHERETAARISREGLVRERSGAAVKTVEGPRERNPFLEEEAEMSDDGGHSNDGSDSDVDDDGDLADLIGEGRERRKDSKRRQKLHATWAKQRDEAEMAGVVAAMRSGWKRNRHNGLGGEEEGNNRDTRRRRAALIGMNDEERDVPATAFDAAALFGSHYATLAQYDDQEPCSDEEIAANEEEHKRDMMLQRFLDISQNFESEPMLDDAEMRALELANDNAKRAAAAAATAAAAARPAHGIFGSDLTAVAGVSFLGQSMPGSNKARRRDFGGGISNASRSFIFGSREDSKSGQPAQPSEEQPKVPTSDAPTRPTSFSGMNLGKPQRTAAATRTLGKTRLLGRLNGSTATFTSSKTSTSIRYGHDITDAPRQVLGMLTHTKSFRLR